MRGLGRGAHGRVHALDHAAEQMRMNGADDGLARCETAAIERFDAAGAAVADLDACHFGIGERLAAVIAYAGKQRVGQATGAATRHAEAAALEKAEEHVNADGRGLLVRRHQVLAGHTRKMHAHFLMLEQLAQQIMAAHLDHAP